MTHNRSTTTVSWTMLVALAFSWALLAVPAALAGVVFEIETTDHSASPPRTVDGQMVVDGKNLKMGIQAGGGNGAGDEGEMVFRGDRRQMVVVDHGDRSYLVLDGESAQRLGGQMQGQMEQAMKQVEKQLEGLDPKQREMMEKMLKGRLGGALEGATGETPQRSPSEFRNTGERASKSGYPCVKYDVLRGGEKVRELWVTDWDNVAGGRQVADAFEDLASFYQEMLSSLTGMFGEGGFFGGMNPIEDLTGVPGFPVVTRSFEGGELESETVLESVSERDLDPDAFEPPKGYRLRTMGPQ